MAHLDIGPTVWALIIATVVWPLVVLWVHSRSLSPEEREEIYADSDKID